MKLSSKVTLKDRNTLEKRKLLMQHVLGSFQNVGRDESTKRPRINCVME